MSECKMCRERGKAWRGSDPECAFAHGEFDRGNWNCATANAIRSLCDRWDEGNHEPEVDYQYCDDQSYATINISYLNGFYDGADSGPYINGGPEALWLSWYKSRGRTESMWLLSHYFPPRKPTEKDCLEIIRYFDRGESN